jgi:hypothetical protein
MVVSPWRRLMEIVASCITASPHLEYYLHWSLAILQYHGEAAKQAGSSLLGALRAIHKSVGAHRDALVKLCVRALGVWGVRLGAPVSFVHVPWWTSALGTVMLIGAAPHPIPPCAPPINPSPPPPHPQV